jgi:hypothetical protein
MCRISKGITVFDANGRNYIMEARPDLPKIASNNPSTPTPEEAKAIVGGRHRLIWHVHRGRGEQNGHPSARSQHIREPARLGPETNDLDHGQRYKGQFRRPGRRSNRPNLAAREIIGHPDQSIHDAAPRKGTFIRSPRRRGEEIGAKSGPMQAHDGLGPHDRHGLENRREQAIQPNEEQALALAELDATVHLAPRHG